jgi:hypothetical protein
MTLVPMQYAAAQGTSRQVINMVCDGMNTQRDPTVYKGDRKYPVNETGMVINLVNRTVSANFFGVAVHITKADAATVAFTGQGPVESGGIVAGNGEVTGSMDRVTGVAHITTSLSFPAGNGALSNQLIYTAHYDLTCKVTNR